MDRLSPGALKLLHPCAVELTSSMGNGKLIFVVTLLVKGERIGIVKEMSETTQGEGMILELQKACYEYNVHEESDWRIG